MIMENIDEIFRREGIEARCTCECGCRRHTLVLSKEQVLNNQCAECHYSHR